MFYFVSFCIVYSCIAFCFLPCLYSAAIVFIDFVSWLTMRNTIIIENKRYPDPSDFPAAFLPDQAGTVPEKQRMFLTIRKTTVLRRVK